MRILFVSPFLPYPPTAGGHALIWGWLRRLASKHEIAFVGFCEREADAVGADEVAKHCASMRIRLRRPTPHAYSSFAQVPRWVSEFFSAELASDLRALARDFEPEVAQFLSTNMAQYARAVDAAHVITAVDVSFVAHRRRIAAARGLERLQARLEWLRMLRYEASVFRRADHVIAMSLRDAEIIRAVSPRVPSTIVPPGVDRELLAPRPRRPGPGRVLYLGQMEHFPNLDGLLFLYREIWPRVRRAHPEARLTVAGRGAREELARVAPQTLAAMESDQSVDLAGFVPDLQVTMDLTAVMAAPLRLGSGVRTKVIEAMAAGLPVVTTTRGAEGLAVAHERELLIADEPEQFARELVRLLRDPELQARLSRAGRELAAREHDNDQLAARLERALMAAAGSAGRACLACPPQDGEARR